MDGDCNTDSLRSLAPHWSLAGDDKLLEILQNTHKRILSKCQDVNAKLVEMTSALDEGSINLQNANNRFMALSNSQFIESRVYDDDDEHTANEEPPAKEQDVRPEMSETDALKKSLSILESMHEVVTILRDSDTESDSDDDELARIVLKPKDLYQERPLPHIIGSEAWKNKWHAGLLVEDSDSDSGASRPAGHTPEYSESEEEEVETSHQPEVTVYEKEEVSTRETSTKAAMSPADMAAELARRLAAQAPEVPEYEEEYSSPNDSQPRPAARTVYKPQQPPTGVVFSDEPPPLEQYDSETSEDDIFAELHRSQPYSKNETARGAFTADLFGDDTGGDMFTDTDVEVSQPRPTPKPSSSLSESAPKVVEQEEIKKKPEIQDEKLRKPIGGISLFGSSKGADSIGAAILKRNMKKQSTSDEEDGKGDEPPSTVKDTDHTKSMKKEKDILNDLFAKPKTDSKKGKIIVKVNTEKVKEDVKKDAEKVDLFSDNIFDDIDDIFSSNIIKVPKDDAKVNKGSIFDDDVDLFADIPSLAAVKVENKDVCKEKKTLFDGDDDLFAEKLLKTKTISSKSESQNTTQFGAENSVVSKKIEAKKDNINELDNDIDIVKPITGISETKDIEKTIIRSAAAKSIFDSDSDSDVFSSNSTSKFNVNDSQLTKNLDKVHIITTTSNTHTNLNIEIDTSISKEALKKDVIESENIHKIGAQAKPFTRQPLFDDGDDENLFASSNNVSTSSNVKDNKIEVIGCHKTDIDIETVNQEKPIAENVETDTTSIVHKTPSIITENCSENLSSEFKEEPVLNISHVATAISVDVKSDTLLLDLEIEETVVQGTNDDDIGKEGLFSEEYASTSNNNIFGEIQNEPPVFEKAKEAKKSKNVNALFDDDSDDEALFFRKSDVIDEVQDDYSSEANRDAVFGLFHDEPPAIDVDFGAKNINPDENETISDANMFSTDSKLHNVYEQPSADVEFMSDTPVYTSQLTGDDSTKDKDLFSSIDSQSIFTPIKESQIIDKEKATEQNDFDDPFKLINDKVPISDQASNVIDKGIPEGEDLFGKITNKAKETTKISTKNTKDLEDPGTLFSSVKRPSKLTPQVPPLDSGFDNSDEELFKSATTIKSRESVLKPTESNVGLFDVINDSKLNNRVVTETNINESEKEERPVPVKKLINNIANTSEVDIIKSGKDFRKHDTNNVAKSNTNIEQKIVAEDIVDRGLNRESDVKKIGKLKSMNLNINVASLLPGASPKKQNKTQTATTQSSNEDEIIENEKITEQTDPKIVKSISFAGDLNSDVLDNKLSKERAKIQVKRRPSTRRARREAVRKSAVDLEDSTDNSSSIDDPPKSGRIAQSKSDPTEMTNKVDSNKSGAIEEKAMNTIDLSKKSESTTVTKVVYVLNDDDIFNTNSKTPNLDSSNQSKNEKFTLGGSLDFTDGIQTIGKVYKDVPLEKPGSIKVNNDKKVGKTATKSLFGDQSDDDDELFNKSKKPPSKPSIFDSGSEEELFTGNKKEVKKILVKSSLFGDDDDDGDDLFGVKTSKNTGVKASVSVPQASRELPKSSEPVFNDPLSMLDDD